jgi:hypothetical protein
MNMEHKKSMNTKQKPEHEIRLGKIRATIWANELENGVRYSVTLSRLYKNDEGHWRDSTSFGREDLPLLGKVLDMAHTWLYEQRSDSASETSEAKDKQNPLAAYVGGSRR